MRAKINEIAQSRLEESLLNVLDVQQHYIHAYQIKYKNIIS
jgi:hypothetical protein